MGVTAFRVLVAVASFGVAKGLPKVHQPDKLGEYCAVHRMNIDPVTVEGSASFAPYGWRVALIISGDIKEAIETMGLTGSQFTEV